MVAGGAYVLFMEVREALELEVGRLGLVRFSPGLYAYVGSAKRGLKARVRRHLRRTKVAKWHIDHLTPLVSRSWATLIPSRDPPECFLACQLVRMAKKIVKGFGATDCSCPSHLVYLGESMRASTPKSGGPRCHDSDAEVPL